MKPAPFEYHRPASADEAVVMLDQLGEEAKIIAGGQSLLPIMNLRLAEPEHLIDISGLRDLSSCETTGETVTYGAATTHQAVEDGLAPDPCMGLLAEAAAGIGYRAIRCRGTVGGSLAHADSSAEWPTVLTAVDAEVTARSVRGDRTLPLRGFFHGFFSTSLEPDEILTRVTIPHFTPGTRWALEKTNRKAGEFAESLAVVVLTNNSASSVWLGAARDVPVQLSQVEALLDSGSRAATPMWGEVRERVLADLELTWSDLDLVGRHQAQLHTATVHRALVRALSSEVSS